MNEKKSMVERVYDVIQGRLYRYQIRLMLISGLTMLSVGCNPSTTSNSADELTVVEQGTVLVGQLFDGLLDGVGFVTDAGIQGVTSASGTFKFKTGETVTFYLGNAENKIAFGTAKAKSSIKLSDLEPVSGDLNKDFTANVMSFLNALDGDLNDGITIPQAAKDEIAVRVKDTAWTIDFNVSKQGFVQTPGLENYLQSQYKKLSDLQVYWDIRTKSRSSTIALTSDDRYLIVANRQNNSVSIIQVRDEADDDLQKKIDEIEVGNEPHSVAITPDDRWAYVSNSVSGTVSVINLQGLYADGYTQGSATVSQTITVGTEPRGVSISPNGKYAFIANHTSGNVSVIDTTTYSVIKTVSTGGNPFAIAITNDGDNDDRDETVYVTRFFSESISASRPDGFNDAKEGVVDSFVIGEVLDGDATITQLKLSPLDSGFSADRRHFCLETRKVLETEGTVFFKGAESLKNDTFCPDTASTDATPDGVIAKDPQQVYPNQLYAVLLRGSSLYVPNIGASPEPPIKFNLNVQALISVLNTKNGDDRSVNLNNQIKAETQPTNPTESLDRVFGNDVVAIDADIKGEKFLIVSRGGNYVISAWLDDEGQLSIAAPNVVRYQTGNLPSGIVMSSDGTRAYTNNEVSTSVTAIDLTGQKVIEQDIASSEPPAIGTKKHRNILGKLAFFTALGIPDHNIFDKPIRDIVPLQFRGKASDNGWSSCGSCHPDGHSDNVTWLFPTGPRQTVPLEGMFAKGDLNDQRILNWNGVRGSVTDFNNNSRGVQGGIGHATNVNGVDRTTEVFNHGPTSGISDALDAMTEWVANAVRAPIMPDLQDASAGRAIFKAACATCHGGKKWTKSQTAPVYVNNPTFSENPLGAGFFNEGKVPPLDADLEVKGPQIFQVNNAALGISLKFLDNVGTFDENSVLEIRGAGAIDGQSTQGFGALTAAGGFNAPSLLGVGYHAPYLHDGSAVTLKAVYAKHTLPDGDDATADPTIADQYSDIERDDLTSFLESIDEKTEIFRSATDDFLDPSSQEATTYSVL